MVKRRDKPDNRSEQLALHVAAGISFRGACRKLGIPRTTGRRLSAKPGFKQRVAELRDAYVARTNCLLSRLSVKASRRLSQLLDAKDETVVLRAVRSVFAGLIPVRESTDLAERLAALEKRQLDGAGEPPDWSPGDEQTP